MDHDTLSLLAAQSKFLAAYHEKLDPADANPFPRDALYLVPLGPELTGAMQVTMIDNHTADVGGLNTLRYRVVFLNGRWRIRISTSVQTRYGDQTEKALAILTTSFKDLVTLFNTLSADITRVKLTTPESVITASKAGIATVRDTMQKSLPPAIDLPKPE